MQCAELWVTSRVWFLHSEHASQSAWVSRFRAYVCLLALNCMRTVIVFIENTAAKGSAAYCVLAWLLCKYSSTETRLLQYCVLAWFSKKNYELLCFSAVSVMKTHAIQGHFESEPLTQSRLTHAQNRWPSYLRYRCKTN